MSRSTNCRCPGAWSINDARRIRGRFAIASNVARDVGGRNLAAQVDIMVGPQAALACAASTIVSAMVSMSSEPSSASSSIPTRRASKTVVMPEAAICASWACSAAIMFQRTLGRGR